VVAEQLRLGHARQPAPAYAAHRLGALRQRRLGTGGEFGAILGLDLQHVIPLPPLVHQGGQGREENPPTDVLAFGAFVNDTVGDLPYYSLPTLGGSHTLRGYIQNRFTDRASAHASAEYRVNLIARGITFTDTVRIERIGCGVFYDCGTVADGIEDLHRRRFLDSYGFGLRMAFAREACSASTGATATKARTSRSRSATPSEGRGLRSELGTRSSAGRDRPPGAATLARQDDAGLGCPRGPRPCRSLSPSSAASSRCWPPPCPARFHRASPARARTCRATAATCGRSSPTVLPLPRPDPATREAKPAARRTRRGDRRARDGGPAIVPGDPEHSELWRRISPSTTTNACRRRQRQAAVRRGRASSPRCAAGSTAAPLRAALVVRAAGPPPVPAGDAAHPIDRFLAERARRPARRIRRPTGDALRAAVPGADRPAADARTSSAAFTPKPRPIAVRTAGRPPARRASRTAAATPSTSRAVARRRALRRHQRHPHGRRPPGWAWRDWLLRALRDDLPFDRFVTEQLAGDLLPDATSTQKVATGFLRNHVTTDEGGAIDEEYLVEYAAERTRPSAACSSA
jgi:hypothetical protein